jgi:hypothetical protein
LFILKILKSCLKHLIEMLARTDVLGSLEHHVFKEMSKAGAIPTRTRLRSILQRGKPPFLNCSFQQD